jgi:hypothetical protein
LAPEASGRERPRPSRRGFCIIKQMAARRRSHLAYIDLSTRPTETKKLRIPPLDTLLDYIQCSYCRSISKPQNHVGSAHLKNIILEDVALKCLPDPHNLRALVVG